MNKLNSYYDDKFDKKITSNSLKIAALAGLSFFGSTNSASAAETPLVPTLGEGSAYTLNEVSLPSDNSFTVYKYDNTGITEAINYEVNLLR